MFLWRGATPVAPEQGRPEVFATEIRPLLSRYCYDCHNETKSKGDVNLTAFADTRAIQRGRATWQRAWQLLHTRDMPPEDAAQPTLEERATIADWIEKTLNDIDCDGPRDPGRIVLRRLTRYEYRNTIRDLVGVDFHPAADFPADNIGYGFDNIGDVLNLSPLLMEKYLAAAESILDEAIVLNEGESWQRRFSGDQLQATEIVRTDDGEEKWLEKNGEVWADVQIDRGGAYLWRVCAWGTPCDGAWPRMVLQTMDRKIKTFEVAAPKGEPGVYEVRVDLEPGRHRLAAAFINKHSNTANPDLGQRDRKLMVRYFELQGPVESGPELSEPLREIFDAAKSPGLSNRAAAAVILERFASRAFRRPVAPAELAKYLALLDGTEVQEYTFEQALKAPMAAILISPHFLFRVEGLPGQERQEEAPGIVGLGDYELATRLSYFIWSSMPDEELMSWARSGRLSRESVLVRQVRRMLSDPRAAALAENFATQWLQLRRMQQMSPDPVLFPTFTSELRQAMYDEVICHFDAIRRDNRSILDLIDSDRIYANEVLARHYGLKDVLGPQMRSVPVVDRSRGGVLTSAAVLMATSNPTRTNPTRRGKWVLETILGTPPPPPVPDAGELESIAPTDADLSVRQRLELHRSDPACAGCHARMDPIGFAFEHYNAIGAWRSDENGRPIDDTGTLPDGRTFRGPAQFKELLLEQKEQFARTLLESMLTYALGRGLEYNDVCSIRPAIRALAEDDYRFSTLVTEIARSYPFRYRRTADFKDQDSTR